MTWLLMPNGTEQDLSGPGAAQPRYSLQSLAHQLAQIDRYTGATRRPYSVAEHSLLCADMAHAAGHGPLVQLCCLMHDAHEAITGDVASPVKWHLGYAWSSFEGVHARALRRHFGLQQGFVAHSKLVRHFDLVALATERAQLLRFDPAANRPWPVIDTPGQAVPASQDYNLVSAWREQLHWSEWRERWHDAATELLDRARAKAAREATA